MTSSDVQSQPPAAPRREKRLIFCLDGTWNSAFEETQRRGGDKVMKPTNALKISRAVKPFDEKTGMAQVTYYDLGVGALAEYPGTANRLLHTIDRTLGGAWGAGFEGNVEDALNFLVHNYEPGDEVFLFGFSRGAAQARAITHFLDWNGGVPDKRDAYYLPKLFRLYVTTQGRAGESQRFFEAKNEEITEENKTAPPDRQRRLLHPFRKVRVRYLGVWDTVAALGSRLDAVGEHTSVSSRTFYFRSTPAECVEHARQALAIDERRYDFRPEIWKTKRPHQTMEQRWFAGVHTNVGGGYGYDGLANVPLHWIADGAKAEELCLDDDFLKHYGPWVKHSLYDSYTSFYKRLDGIRQCSGDGVRCLTGHPPEANLALDSSVIERMQADPKDLYENGDGTPATAYRPQNVIEYLAGMQNLPPLPADVMTQIDQLRRRRGLPVPPPAVAPAES
jgi:uncharacterized protein (DUF2235 family)